MVDVEAELKRLTGLPASRLRIEWRRHLRSEAPQRLSRDLLLRAVSYKVQEQTHGGLTQTAKNMLTALTAQFVAEAGARVRPVLRPGVRLVRDWRGQTYSVLVLEDGFHYQGRHYRSLTEIARTITGAHWSGPRFFGVATAQKARPALARISPTAADDAEKHGAV